MNSKVMIPLALLLVTPFETSILDKPSCLTEKFYGNYRDGSVTQSVFLPDAPCLESWTASTHAVSGSIVESIPPASSRTLVWLEELAVEDALKTQSFTSGLDSFLERLSAPTRVQLPDGDSRGQDVLTIPRAQYGFELFYRSQSAALLSLRPETARTIDTILPPFWRSTPLPASPVSYEPVPQQAIDHVKDLLSKLKFNPAIAAIVNNISVSQMENDIRFLTGENGKSGIVSRHSFHSNTTIAAKWLKDRFEDTGATCTLRPFLPGFAPNVICRYPSSVKTTATVLLSAHYDSRGSFGSTRAPGGNDDGSGTTSLLAIARTIARKGVKFRSNVELVAFAGEEQGLYGSKAYSSELREANSNLTLMIQADMLAYHAPGEPPQLGLPEWIGTLEVAHLVGNVSSIYSPELQVGFTPACCSDHQSFHERGFPATQVFERAGPIADPMYHNSGDLSDREGYDLQQVKSIAKVQFATLLHTAGFDVPE